MKKTAIEEFERIAESGQVKFVDGVLVDAHDAKRVVQLWQTISDHLRKDLLSLSLIDICDLAWEIFPESEVQYESNLLSDEESPIPNNLALSIDPELAPSPKRGIANHSWLLAAIALILFLAGATVVNFLSHSDSKHNAPADLEAQESSPHLAENPPNRGRDKTFHKSAISNTKYELDNFAVDLAPGLEQAIDNVIQSESHSSDERIHPELNDLLEKMNSASEQTTKPIAQFINKEGLRALKLKHYAEASHSFARAVQEAPSDPKLLSNLGYAQTFAGHFDSAKKNLYLSIFLNPARPVAWGDLGLLFAKTGEMDKAVACLVLGFKVSKGETISFLNSLADDEDPAVRQAGELALRKVTGFHQSQTNSD
ncbi:MAG: hypothetical protein K2X81_20670 [Candidatus Obscuribacterales bacterium]|nr:hypothetical protein [Candidatus Obscuribacterales bacterium]MBX9723833.1 hypothetical protein [Candidatus Obscuribacterales bacterium]